MSERIGVAIVGCGNIAGPYAEDFANYPELDFRGVADLDLDRAGALAAKVGVSAYSGIDDLLADPAVELVVNLTTFHAHREVTARCLEAGKHVYSEKPLAMTYAQARELVELARRRGRRLGCSPFTLLGEAQQTAWKLLRDGKIGRVRVAYAEANQGRIETWHPAPQAFYDIGVVYDVGVYPITLVACMLAPVRQVRAYGRVVMPDRVTVSGESYHVSTPDWTVALLLLEDGTLVRLTSSFYTPYLSKQVGIEFHGDLGSLHLESNFMFDAAVQVAPLGEEYQPVEPLRAPSAGVPWGRGAREMAVAILTGRPHRFSGELAAHVSEVLEAIKTGYETGATVEVTSTFTPPAPLDWTA